MKVTIVIPGRNWKSLGLNTMLVLGIFALSYVVLNIPIVSLSTRPIMHTFREHESDDDDLLDIWQDEWKRAGFDTKILTLKDAQKHPYFKNMEEVVTPLFGARSANAMGFYRWLAMGATDGGWMSELDTLPTMFPQDDGFNLPHGGNFTSFEVHVPSLMSGRSDEWTRVAMMLVDAIPRANGMKTEMMALEKVKDEGNSGIHFESMYNVQIGLVYENKHRVNCEKMKGRAVHMAHPYVKKAFDKQLFPIEITGPGPAKDYRAQAVKAFMDDWRYQCLSHTRG